jgi:nickel-dependent lactate racemase
VSVPWGDVGDIHFNSCNFSQKAATRLSSERTISLRYGAQSEVHWVLPADASVDEHRGPMPLQDLAAAVAEGLVAPFEFPPFVRTLTAGDRIVLAVERGLTATPQLVAAVWNTLATAGVLPSQVMILQPAAWASRAEQDPRELLPVAVRQQIVWQKHDPTVESACGYLASSASGERLYLARELLEADVVLPISSIGFDPVTGFRGTSQVLYPGLSTTAALAKSIGQGHRELRPSDERPLRQLSDEAGWLLGVQCVMELIPSATGLGIAEVLVGQAEPLQRRSRKRLERAWRVARSERVECVVATVPTIGRANEWDDVAAAAEAAMSLVERGGRIVLLSDLSAEVGPGLELLRHVGAPKAALLPLRDQAPPDLIAATRLARAADWASVYLLSRLSGDLVEELFMVPLESERELMRLLATCIDSLLLQGAQHTFGEVAEAEDDE